MNGASHVILIGLRGCGKSTLGAQLAQRLGRPFLDLDEVTPRVMGFLSVREAWAALGEAAFRKAEVEALRAAVGDDAPPPSPKVIALGGGTPTAPGAADTLREAQDAGCAVIVYLRGEPETLRARLMEADNADRPSLTGGDVLDEVREVFQRRDPLYRELASRTIAIDALDEAHILLQLLEASAS